MDLVGGKTEEIFQEISERKDQIKMGIHLMAYFEKRKNVYRFASSVTVEELASDTCLKQMTI